MPSIYDSSTAGHCLATTMSESKLDQIVKGAPPPGSKIPAPSRTPSPTPSVSISHHGDTGPSTSSADPVSLLPSSAPQIYLNLLILEASLRSQYLTLRARRRQHTFFLLLLGAWIVYFFWALFLRPREDGRGVGGSVYWVVETAEKMALLGGVVTAILVWGTGQWERGIRWPRRWVVIANRGLRNVNAKVVVIKGPWWREMLSMLAFLLPSPSLFLSRTPSYHFIEDAAGTRNDRKRYGSSRHASRDRSVEEGLVPEEDLSPGGDLIKLLLLPKPFSPDFRENWELYRTEYWEKENERRATLRRQLRQRQREIARQEGGWLWWTGWRGWKSARSLGTRHDGEKGLHPVSHQHHAHRHHLGDQRTEKDLRRRAKGSSRSESYSGASSRSTTPTRDVDDGSSKQHVRRRSSNASSNGGRARKTRRNSSNTSARPKRLTTELRASSASRPGARPQAIRADSFRTSTSGGESD